MAYTIHVAEKGFATQLNGDQQFGDTEGWFSGFLPSTLRTGYLPPSRDYLREVNAAHDDFGSAHPWAMNALFADGSVRQISYEIGDHAEVRPVWSLPLADFYNTLALPPPAPPNSARLTLFQRLCHRSDGSRIDWRLLE